MVFHLKEYIEEYSFGGILDADKIKNDLTKENIEKVKEKENIPTMLKTKKKLSEKITDFVKNIMVKFLQ